MIATFTIVIPTGLTSPSIYVIHYNSFIMLEGDINVSDIIVNTYG